MVHFIDDPGALQAGDLVLSGDAERVDVSDWRRAPWTDIGVVVRRDQQAGVGAGQMMYLDLTSGVRQPLNEALDAIAGRKVTFAARIDLDPTDDLEMPTGELIGTDVSDALVRVTEVVSYSHIDRLIRTCKFDGNERPCPQHG